MAILIFEKINHKYIIIERKVFMPQLPKDPVMLLSFTNTQLRDNFSNLSDFCKAFMISEADISEALKKIDYEYDSRINQFI